MTQQATEPQALGPEAELDAVQLVWGVKQQFRMVSRAQKGLDIFAEVLDGGRKLPILRMATGEEELDLDINVAVRHDNNEEAAGVRMQAILSPINDYFLVMLSQSLNDLISYCQQLVIALSGGDVPRRAALPGDDYDDWTRELRASYAKFESLGDTLIGLLDSDDPLGDMRVSIGEHGGTVSLAHLLDFASEDDPEAEKLLRERVLANHSRAAAGAAVPHLLTMADHAKAMLQAITA